MVSRANTTDPLNTPSVNLDALPRVSRQSATAEFIVSLRRRVDGLGKAFSVQSPQSRSRPPNDKDARRRRDMGSKRSIPGMPSARSPTQTRRAIYGTLILLPIAVWLGLMEAYVAIAPVSLPPQDGDADAVVALPNRTTLLEPRGTAGRKIADWLSTHSNRSREFEVGDNQFRGDTANLTTESVKRISRLAAVLKAESDVRIGIIGYSAAEPDTYLGLRLSKRRADEVRDQLIQFGIPADRIWVEDRGTANTVASDGAAAARRQSERVSIFLTRDPAGSGRYALRRF